MKLQNQVCTIGQAQKLKSLGIEQKGLFTWCIYCPDQTGEKHYELIFYENDNSPEAEFSEIIAIGFTVAELGQMLGRFARNTSSLDDDGNEAIDRADDLIHLLGIGELLVDSCNERLNA